MLFSWLPIFLGDAQRDKRLVSLEKQQVEDNILIKSKWLVTQKTVVQVHELNRDGHWNHGLVGKHDRIKCIKKKWSTFSHISLFTQFYYRQRKIILILQQLSPDRSLNSCQTYHLPLNIIFCRLLTVDSVDVFQIWWSLFSCQEKLSGKKHLLIPTLDGVAELPQSWADAIPGGGLLSSSFSTTLSKYSSTATWQKTK